MNIIPLRNKLTWYFESILNSYSQVFFSDNKVFAVILMAITFVDFYTGLFGLLTIIITTSMARWIGFDNEKTRQGYYGFNALLVGLGIGIYFQPGLLLLLIVVLAAVLSLFIAVALEGVIGKYALPYLSLPFVFALWAIMLASREFQALGLNERGIFTLNELYIVGGHTLVKMYDWWGNLPFPASLRSYFLSLGAIFFQFNVFTGVLVAAGLLVYSRIAFTLSLLGFYTAYLFYIIIGASFTEVSYSYIGFNYILSAIAIGGYFIIPNRSSYLWVMLLIPMVAILTISLSSILYVYQLPIYSLPFNMMALLFLYVLKFRLHNRIKLSTLFIQQHAPEKNLYSFVNFQERFGKNSSIPLQLPFFGEWTVTQGYDGEITHKAEWRHALDFEMKDEEGKTYRAPGDTPKDYYCYDKVVIAAADGMVEKIIDGIEDNIIGQKNLEHNWGNTIVIKHNEHLYTKLSHLKKGSFVVKEGDKIKQGDPLARCGNSGLSPYPHLHFQVQATPYVGSKTIDYPISNFLLSGNNGYDLKTVDVPKNGETVSNIQINQSLKKAFHFIPGEQIRLSVDQIEAIWEIKRDLYLNTYIECEKSGCRAWFKSEEGMHYFTHFDGNRDSLLYYFYLGAYKVCLGHYKNLELTDRYPTNLAFKARELILHDFIAPFFMYKRARYRIKYTTLKESFSDTRLLLQAESIKQIGNKEIQLANVAFNIDRHGLQGFKVTTKNRIIEASCTEKRPV